MSLFKKPRRRKTRAEKSINAQAPLDTQVMTEAPPLQEHTEVHVKWIKVETPRPWRPKPGEQLEGIYTGSHTRHNRATQEPYECHVISTYTGTFYLTGTMIDSLIASAEINDGELIRIVFTGMKDTGKDRQMKMYEMYVGKL